MSHRSSPSLDLPIQAVGTVRLPESRWVDPVLGGGGDSTGVSLQSTASMSDPLPCSPSTYGVPTVYTHDPARIPFLPFCFP